jgi:hypothetical protein
MRELPMGTRLMDSTPQAITTSCEVHGLLAGAALAVDGGGGHMGRQARSQPGQAARRAGLLARLAHAARDHVVHRARVDAAALHQLLQHLAEQIDGMETGQGAVGLGPGHGAADGIDDDGDVHMNLMRLLVHEMNDKSRNLRRTKRFPG